MKMASTVVNEDFHPHENKITSGGTKWSFSTLDLL